MSEKYKIGEPERPHFITTTVIDWVDLFTRPVYKDILVDSLNYCTEYKSLTIYAYCIMPSHIHLIASSQGPALNQIMRDLKKFTSKRLIEAIKKETESRGEWLLNKFSFAAKRINRGVNYKVWQDGFHPVELTSNAMMDQKLEYVHNNPVVEGYVHLPEQWVYSSAGFYLANEESRVALQMLE